MTSTIYTTLYVRISIQHTEFRISQQLTQEHISSQAGVRRDRLEAWGAARRHVARLGWHHHVLHD